MSSLIRVTIISLILILSTVSFVRAQSDLADYLSEKIYNDCSGQDIKMSGAIARTDIKAHEAIIYLLTPQNNYYLVKINLMRKELNEITTVLTNNEPYNFYMSAEDTGPEDDGLFLFGKDGRNILYCGNKSLTINLMTYYWNGKRIDPFVITNQKIENITQKVEKMENYYTNVSGQSNMAIGLNSSAKSEVRTIFNIPITTREISISLFSGLFSLSIYFITIKLKNWISKKK